MEVEAIHSPRGVMHLPACHLLAGSVNIYQHSTFLAVMQGNGYAYKSLLV